jgi:CDGSH-type Zn-finger protein
MATGLKNTQEEEEEEEATHLLFPNISNQLCRCGQVQRLNYCTTL